jgi:tetratricopeptide (TPR) repeat protein
MARLLTTKLITLAALTLLAACPSQSKNEAIKRANAGAKALSAKQFDTAVTEFKEATRLDRDNFMAWYQLGEAYRAKKEWDEAVEAFENASRIRPNDVMLNVRFGAALYEQAVDRERQAEATRTKKKPEEVTPDLRGVNFDQSLQRLEAAVKTDQNLYNAQYYIGRIYRDQFKDAQAADAFTKAILAWPRFGAPYIALGELYRRWDYPNEAIQVVSQGVEHVMENEDKSKLFYILGMAYFDKVEDAKAITAFTEALKLSKDNHKAKFQRGQSHFRMGQLKEADKDFEEFSKSAGGNLAALKGIAQKFRFQIAAKQTPPGG